MQWLFPLLNDGCRAGDPLSDLNGGWRGGPGRGSGGGWGGGERGGEGGEGGSGPGCSQVDSHQMHIA